MHRTVVVAFMALVLLAPSRGVAQPLQSFEDLALRVNLDDQLMAGAFGAGLGLAVGAFIHKTTIVYPEPEARTSVVPAISRHAVGVRVSVRW